MKSHTFQAKAGELAPRWFIIDANEQVVGRLAAQIAPFLMGKHRPTYTPNIDTGDFVIVTNVDKVVFTGEKWRQKTYQRYSGWPGGQSEEAAWKLFQRHPERILELAIRRMMPKNKIGRHMMSKLKLYVGATHPHQAQQPILLEALAGRPAADGKLLAPKPKPKAAYVRPIPADLLAANADLLPPAAEPDAALEPPHHETPHHEPTAESTPPAES